MTAVPMHCRGSFQPPHPSTVWSPHCTFSTVQPLDRVGRAHSWSHKACCGVYVWVCVHEHHEQNCASSLSPLSLYSANYSHAVRTVRGVGMPQWCPRQALVSGPVPRAGGSLSNGCELIKMRFGGPKERTCATVDTTGQYGVDWAAGCQKAACSARVLPS